MDAIETEKKHGRVIKIVHDDDPMSPREWDNLGTMACWHRRYNLGDKQIRDGSEAEALMKKWGNGKTRDGIALPLYLYDHSGITMSCGPFACPWDSGLVGVIYVERERILKEYNVTRISPQVREKVLAVLRCEVNTYDCFIRGAVYGYIIKTPEGEHIDSCFGFFGMDDVKEAAHEANEALPTQLELALPVVG
jgi:hypothetical protein